MFDFGSVGGGELLVIGIIALLVIGPKELPGLIRSVGQMLGKVRHMAWEFRQQFDEAMREAENVTGKAELEKLNEQVSSASSFNPIDTIRKEISNAVEAVKGETQAGPAPAAEAAPIAVAAAPDVLQAATENAVATLEAPAKPDAIKI